MQRRNFLRLAATLPTLTLAGRLFAAPASPARFLLVFLRGGYDCANFLVPYSSSFYYEARPHIAIPRPDASTPAGALALDADWALAPAVRGTLEPLYQARQLAFVPFAGTDDVSRSHFETQDSIELGEPSQGQRDFGSGFMGRLVQVLQASGPIAFTDALPLIFKGGADIPNVSLRGIGKPAFDERQTSLLSGMYAEHHLESAVTDGLALRQEVALAMADEMRAANRGAINTKGFALEAERMGKLMRDQYRLGFVDVGGWDTHVNEGAAQGALANNLDNLSRGLVSFSQALGAQWQSTVVLVVSEFGRTFRENGNNGTDHGHGSVYWVLGGALNGGRIAGEQRAVERATLFQDRDYPVLNNYRAVISGLFRSMWDLSGSQLQRVFPAVTPLDLKLI
ncbi:MAG TPA: DUF1501 domain-containing protein [Steroidobacteraceae bacterium]|jgi:uncharacterized protein (DUF1501 family)|nr:DUF1501 domain-containing protein [Steroidobacteraceae bacterium]